MDEGEKKEEEGEEREIKRSRSWGGTADLKGKEPRGGGEKRARNGREGGKAQRGKALPGCWLIRGNCGGPKPRRNERETKTAEACDVGSDFRGGKEPLLGRRGRLVRFGADFSHSSPRAAPSLARAASRGQFADFGKLQRALDSPIAPAPSGARSTGGCACLAARTRRAVRADLASQSENSARAPLAASCIFGGAIYDWLMRANVNNGQRRQQQAGAGGSRQQHACLPRSTRPWVDRGLWVHRASASHRIVSHRIARSDVAARAALSCCTARVHSRRRRRPYRTCTHRALLAGTRAGTR